MTDHYDPLVWPAEVEIDNEPDGYRIGDDADIDRILRWRRDSVERIAAIEERAAKMAHEIEEWRRSSTESDRRNVEALDDAIRLHLSDTERTSFSSPFGTVSSRRATPRLIVEDGARVEAVARILEAAGHDDLVERRVRIADAKRALHPAHDLDSENPDEAPAVDPATGQIIPGLRFTTGGRTWTVK